MLTGREFGNKAIRIVFWGPWRFRFSELQIKVQPAPGFAVVICIVVYNRCSAIAHFTITSDSKIPSLLIVPEPAGLRIFLWQDQ